MKILKAGTKVRTIIGSIEAFITEVGIKQNSIEYRLSYFKNGDHAVCWVHDFEIELTTEKRSAGFNRDESTQNDSPIFLDLS